MVTSDTRNNVAVIVIIIAAAILITAFVSIFANTLVDLANHGEKTVNRVGSSVAANISEATEVNKLNLNQFNRSINDVIKSNKQIVVSNNATIGNLTNVVDNFSKANVANGMGLTNLIRNNTHTFQALLEEHHKTTNLLQNISKQLSILPVTPIPYNPQNKTCNIYSHGFPFCILPPNHPIFDLINKSTHK